MTTVRMATVPTECDGQRLDRALPEMFPGSSRSAFSRLISEGQVSVDGQPATRSSARVSAGERIEVRFPPLQTATAESEELPLEIVFQDADLAVINKPAGLVVHPAAGHARGTLVNAILFHVKDLSGIGGEMRPGIVHRLDKDTSGLIVVAKNDASHRQLASVWNTGRVRKEYLTVVYGTPDPAQGVISASIGRDLRDRKRMAVVPSGRRATTEYEVRERLRYASVVRCLLHSGRTHQIRVHLKHIGHPIVGDPVYSGPQWRGIPDRKLQKSFSSFPRQALHASSLTIPHPTSDVSMTFHSELPPDMRTLIDALR